MNSIVLSVIALVATLAFAWLAGGILTAVSWVIARVGNSLHKSLGLLPRNESDAWLFVLLIGISRVPIIVLASICFAGMLITGLLAVPEIVPLLFSLALQLLIVLLLMRLIAILVGGILIGGSVRTLLKTLKS